MSGIATLGYGLIAGGGASASSAQAGYPASNVLLGNVSRPWKSLALGSDWLQVDFGQTLYPALIAINGVNMTSANVYFDGSSVPTTLRGSIACGTDKQGRTKGSIFLGGGYATANVFSTPVITSLGGGVQTYQYFMSGSTAGFTVGQLVHGSDGTHAITGTLYDVGSNYLTFISTSLTITGSANLTLGTALTTVGGRYLRISGFSGALDAATYWQIASVFAFANQLTFARDPLFGESSNDLNHPQARADLDNGITVADSTGPSFMTPTLQFSGGAADDHEQIVRLTKAGLCWLNLNDGNVGDQWPVRHYEPKTTRKFAGFNRETVQVPLKEYVGGV